MKVVNGKCEVFQIFLTGVKHGYMIPQRRGFWRKRLTRPPTSTIPFRHSVVLLSAGTAYRNIEEHYDEERYRTALLTRLQKQAAHFGFHLTPQQEKEASVS